MTLHKSSMESTSATTIFLNPGNLDIDLSGRSTLKLLSVEMFGNIGTMEIILMIEIAT